MQINVNAVSSVEILRYGKFSKILNTSWLLKRSRQTVQTQIRLLLKKQSDLCLHCFQKQSDLCLHCLLF